MFNQDLFTRLSNSKFRSSFHLKPKDIDYINQKGLEEIKKHAIKFIQERLAPSYIKNDGKQTPYQGHPVFIAQHATATCCRTCLEKWHHIPKSRALTNQEQQYIVSIILSWIKKEYNQNISKD